MENTNSSIILNTIITPLIKSRWKTQLMVDTLVKKSTYAQ